MCRYHSPLFNIETIFSDNNDSYKEYSNSNNIIVLKNVFKISQLQIKTIMVYIDTIII